MYLIKLLFLLIFLFGNASSYSISLLNVIGTTIYASNYGCRFLIYLHVSDYSDEGTQNLTASAPFSIECQEVGNKNSYCLIEEINTIYQGSGTINITDEAETVFQIPYKCLGK